MPKPQGASCSREEHQGDTEGLEGALVPISPAARVIVYQLPWSALGECFDPECRGGLP